VPPSISEWSQAALEFENPEEAASTALCEIATKFANIRSGMSAFHDYSNCDFIIASLCELDNEYTTWLNHCPVSLLYKTVTLSERSKDVFSDHYHIYSSLWTATVWNNYRCVRILINEVILDQLNHVFQHPDASLLFWDNPNVYRNQALASNAMLLQLSHDICSSVPFFLGYHTGETPKAVSGNLLLWPLYSAAVTGMVSDMMRIWVAGRLKIIADVLGIRQAAPLAYTLGFTDRRPVEQDLLEWKEEDMLILGYTPTQYEEAQRKKKKITLEG